MTTLIILTYGAIVAALAYRVGSTVARSKSSGVPVVLYDAKADANSYWRVSSSEAPQALHRYIRERVRS